MTGTGDEPHPRHSGASLIAGPAASRVADVVLVQRPWPLSNGGDAITVDELGLDGRDDLMRDVDEVVSGSMSMSYSAPHLFGERLRSFTDEVRRLLTERSPSGEFWDWPGDTAITIARKPAVST